MGARQGGRVGHAGQRTLCALAQAQPLNAQLTLNRWQRQLMLGMDLLCCEFTAMQGMMLKIVLDRLGKELFCETSSHVRIACVCCRHGVQRVHRGERAGEP